MIEKIPAISLIVPVYKVEPWLSRCLDSILAQEFEDFECILVDDGSPDNSGKICDAYAAKDERIIVIHQKNSGASHARNVGLDIARGTYLAFCDADDEMDRRALLYGMKVLQEYPDAQPIWEEARSYEEFQKAKQRPIQYKCVERKYLSWNQALLVALWNKLFVRDIIEKNKIRFDVALTAFGEDIDFVHHYWQAAKPIADKVVYCPVPLYYYSQENVTSLMHLHYQNTTYTAKEDVLAPQPKYCQKILDECQGVLEAMADEILQDPTEFAVLIDHYLGCLAYGVWSAWRLKEKLPKNFYKNETLKRLLDFCLGQRHFSPLFLPFYWKNSWLICIVYHWKATGNKNYYRTIEVFRYIFQSRR